MSQRLKLTVAVSTVFVAGIGSAFWGRAQEVAIRFLSPLGLSSLALGVWMLMLIAGLITTWLISLFFENRSLKRAVLEYDPEHFSRQEFGGWFKVFAKASDRKRGFDPKGR